MKRLDDILQEIENCKTTIIIKGKEYLGNNPYLLNKINNLLESGDLSIDDIQSDNSFISVEDNSIGGKYLYHERLEKITFDICEELEELRNKKREERKDES
jgi:hypothetical protein